MSVIRIFPFAILAIALSVGCGGNTSTKESGMTRKITSEPWGKSPEGEPVELYTITNAKGAEVRIMTYGGTVVSLKVPDRTGAMGDVVLGFDSLDGYVQKTAGPTYIGTLIGRYGNRIGKAKFTLNGVAYSLPKNNGENTLHGGHRGFDKVIWKAKEAPGQSLELTYLSKDGEEGFPGNLISTVT